MAVAGQQVPKILHLKVTVELKFLSGKETLIQEGVTKWFDKDGAH